MLSAEQVACYGYDGFLVLPAFKSLQSLIAAKARAYELVEAPTPTPATPIFSSTDPARLADATLMASASEVHCFFEEEAFDARGQLRQAKAQSINKIGHALHDRDEVFNAFSRGPELAELAQDLGICEPQLWQSMLIFKQPHIGGEVRWHQDASFFVTTPSTVTTFWFALEDATLDNGCLWVQPGGHRTPLREQFVCDHERFAREGQGLRMVKLDDTPWPCTDSDTDAALALPVPAGTLVVFHGQLPHYSAPNRSPDSRLAYTLHVTDGRARYAPSNWLQRDAAFPVRGF